MLFKLLKHDFAYSVKLFLALGAIYLAISSIGAFAARAHHGDYMHLPAVGGVSGSFFAIPFYMVIFPIVIAAAIHIVQFYRKSMFGRVGYLAMTTPISRGKLLASKLIVSMTWFIYALAVAQLEITLGQLITFGQPFFITHPQTIEQLVTSSAAAFFALATVFFCITLSNSAFGGKRIHIAASAALGLLYVWLAGTLVSAATRRAHHFAEFTNIWTQPDGTISHVDMMAYLPMMGLRYGRIHVADMPWGTPVYIDLLQIGIFAGLAAIAIAATLYLLKKRVSIQ